MQGGFWVWVWITFFWGFLVFWVDMCLICVWYLSGVLCGYVFDMCLGVVYVCF